MQDETTDEVRLARLSMFIYSRSWEGGIIIIITT